MKFPRIADEREIIEFLGVEPREATNYESWLGSLDPPEGERVLLYEVPLEDSRKMIVRHWESFLEIQVDVYLNDRLANSYEFNSGRILIETDDNPNLIIFSGDFVLRIGNKPWLLRAYVDSFYANRDWDSDQPW